MFDDAPPTSDEKTIVDETLAALSARAREAPATRRAIRRMTFPWAGLLVLALALLAMGAWRWVNREQPVQGERAAAAVTEIITRTVGRARVTYGTVTVQFDADGRRRTAAIDVGDHVDRYSVGDVVEVVYETGDAGRVAIDGEPLRPSGVPSAALLGTGVALAVAAGLGLRRINGIRRVVSDHAWLAVPATIIEVPVAYGFRMRSRQMLRLRDESRTIYVERVGLGVLPPTLAPLCWATGLGQGRFAVAVPGGAPVFQVRTLDQARRVRRAQ